MVELSPISWKKLVQRFKQLGFDGPFQGGKHPYMIKGTLVLTIPNPHHKQVSIDLLSRILKRAVITKEEWLGK